MTVDKGPISSCQPLSRNRPYKALEYNIDDNGWRHEIQPLSIDSPGDAMGVRLSRTTISVAWTEPGFLVYSRYGLRDNCIYYYDGY